MAGYGGGDGLMEEGISRWNIGKGWCSGRILLVLTRQSTEDVAGRHFGDMNYVSRVAGGVTAWVGRSPTMA